MKARKRWLAGLLAMTMGASLALTGCNGGGTTGGDSADNYIDLAVNVYYNDADHDYYSNEAGQVTRITGEGQYTLSFDCATDLSEEAKAAGVTSLTNLTAIYLLDAGVAEGNQSTITACDIMFDKVVVDGTALTVTQTEAKSAIKSSGIFDTNDPINSWEGSQVEEVDWDKTGHVVNFSTVSNPTKIEITFTLSNMTWEEPETEAEEVVVSDNTYKNTSKFSDMDFTDMTALELTQYLGNGINLGNTMEATLTSANPTTTSVSSFETAWGQPITTAAMIQGMKDCGFDTLRIPVAWTNCIDYKNGDYTIREDLLDRVEEIVNYALDAEMFVIINDHWDYGWWAMFGSNDDATVETAWTLYEQMWTQIAERFKDYSDMVIFESANEELGDGLNDNSDCATSGYLTKDEQYTVTNEINQKFVDIIRSSGGNNDDRFLLIAGYNTDIDKTCNTKFVMPTDTAKSKLFLSVHYYTPWGYCGDKSVDTVDDIETAYSKWGVKDDFETMEGYLSKMTMYTEQGYGIIIGEYGALPAYVSAEKKSYAIENCDVYTAYLLDLCSVYGYCPVLWSTNDSYNKTTYNMITNEMLEVFTSHCYAEEVKAGDSYLDEVKAEMAAYVEAAPEAFETSGEVGGSDEPMAYIMWNGGAGEYNVGDTYTPSSCTSGITPHDVQVDGAGVYTVGLDFAGGNDGLTFGALALNRGEELYPNCILDIQSVVVTDKDGNETQLKLKGLCYTSSDDGVCTRVNLINEWVSSLPDDARNKQNLLGSMATPVILDSTDLVGIYSIYITFELIVPEE